MMSMIVKINDSDIEILQGDKESYLHLELKLSSGKMTYRSICLRSLNGKVQQDGVSELRQLIVAATGKCDIKDCEELIGSTVRFERAKNGRVSWTPAFSEGAAKQFFERQRLSGTATVTA